MQRLVGFLVFAVLAATACTSSGNDATPTTSVQDPVDNVGSEELAFSAEERLELEVRMALVRPASMRPDELSLNDQGAAILVDLLYDGLTEIDASTGVLRPALAETWAANDDFTRWIFALDPAAGVEPIDVIESFGRLADPTRPGAVQAVGRTIDAVIAVDETTVAFDLVAPNAGFPWLVSGLPFSVIGPDGEPSGRYAVAPTDDDGDSVLRLEPSGAGPTVVIDWTETANDAYALLTLGDVDVALTPPDAIDDAELRFGADFPATLTTRFYVLNNASEVLNTREARRAVLAAVDGRTLPFQSIDATGVPVDGLVASSVAGHGDEACDAVCAFDQVAADGTPLVRPLRVAYAGEEERPVAEAMVADLVSGGIEAVSVAFEPEDLASSIVSGEVDVFAFGWIAPAGSIDAVVPFLLAPGSPTNVIRADTAAIGDRLERAAVTADDEERWALLAEAHGLVLNDGLVMPVSQSTSVLARAPHAEVIPIRADGTIDLEPLG